MERVVRRALLLQYFKVPLSPLSSHQFDSLSDEELFATLFRVPPISEEMVTQYYRNHAALYASRWSKLIEESTSGTPSKKQRRLIWIGTGASTSARDEWLTLRRGETSLLYRILL